MRGPGVSDSDGIRRAASEYERFPKRARPLSTVQLSGGQRRFLASPLRAGYPHMDILRYSHTHQSLRQNTLFTTATLADLNCQQVLDNVARFVAHPDALPSLAVVNNGSVLVTDQSSFGGAATYAPTLSHLQQLGGFPILSLFFTPNVTHNLAETWSVVPVTDAEKLRRIRCAFQLLVRGGIESGPCDDCHDRLSKFFNDEKELLDCRLPSGWFQVGCEADVPHDACYVSTFCDTWVWVDEAGIDGLVQFTLSILDLATTDLQEPTKSVVRNYDAEGKLQSTEVTTREGDPESRTGPIKTRPLDKPQSGATGEGPMSQILSGGRTPRDTAMLSKRSRRRVGLSASPLANPR
jgi:hypothetical protein